MIHQIIKRVQRLLVIFRVYYLCLVKLAITNELWSKRSTSGYNNERVRTPIPLFNYMKMLFHYEMASLDHDVLVIGAGPAGLQAARVLSQLDVDFTLLAREDVPCLKKPCGGFIPISAIQEYEIGEVPESYEIQSIRMKFPGLDAIHIDFDYIAGIVVTRESLGRRMVELVESKESIIMGAYVRSLKRKDNAIVVQFTDGQSDHSFNVGLVIDASGANPVSIKDGFVRTRIPNSKMGYGIQYHFQKNSKTTSYSPTLEFYYGGEYSPKGYAWNFPRKFETVIGAGGLIENVKLSEKPLGVFLDDLIDTDPHIKSILAESTLIKKEAALVPLAGVITPSYDERILLAGDAASHCLPISGEGIHYAIMAGDMAAKVANRVINKVQTKKQLAQYEKAWIKKFGFDLKWGLWLQERFTSSESKGGIQFLNSEKTQLTIAEMLVGKRSVRSAMMKSIPSYIKSKL